MPAPACAQFIESGCDNCTFLRMEDDRGARVHDFTTPNFSGCGALQGVGRSHRGAAPTGHPRLPSS